MRFLSVMTVVAALVLAPPARADDEPALIDGGSIVTSTDGGSTVTVDLTLKNDWIMAVRCEGAQSTRYKLCASSTCTVTTHNQILDYDVTQDIAVNAKRGSEKRYLTLKTDDAGIPFCKVQDNR